MPAEFLNSELSSIRPDANGGQEVVRGAQPAATPAAARGFRWKPSKLAKQRLRDLTDVLFLILAFLLAYKLKFDFSVPGHVLRDALVELPLVVCIQFVALRLAGVNRFVWRYTGLPEARGFVVAAGISMIPLVVLSQTLPDELEMLRVPLSVVSMNTVLAFGGLLGLRVLRRAAFEMQEKRKSTDETAKRRKRPILLVGAGHAGMMTAREIQGRGDLDLSVAGFVDDNQQIQQTVISGVRVLGTTSELPRLVREHAIDHVVISMVHGSRQQFRRIVEICESIPVKVRVIPGLSEILRGSVSVSRTRDVRIEDLLGREPVHLEEGNLARLLGGKVVMVTGAGGSIGAEIVRQAARFAPSEILLVERAEPALFQIHHELSTNGNGTRIVPLVADVRDEGRMRRIFETYRPRVIFHAAAHKHVPMMELNPHEALRNNTLATRLLGELAGRHGVETFVLISTDKAVRPSSIMGASKRVAELAIQWLDRRYETRYVAVRFGNVIGSTGSVIPIFQEQINKGGPVTVTHPGMLRYFMTIPEASQLVLQAGAMGAGGEIFILDMGEPISILELAKDTITLSGLKPFEDIEVIFTGPRPGEKLFEELDTKGESVAQTRHPKILIGRIATYPEAEISAALERLEQLSASGSPEEIRQFLGSLLPEAQLGVAITPADETDPAMGADVEPPSVSFTEKAEENKTPAFGYQRDGGGV